MYEKSANFKGMKNPYKNKCNILVKTKLNNILILKT